MRPTRPAAIETPMSEETTLSAPEALAVVVALVVPVVAVEEPEGLTEVVRAGAADPVGAATLTLGAPAEAVALSTWAWTVALKVPVMADRVNV